MKMLRIALSVLVAGFALFATATPALAHTTLKSSSPADGAQLDTPPTAVTLTFEEAVTLPSDPVSVVGPTGAAWNVGTASISGASVTVPVEASGPAGQYTLRYTVIADDGDPVKGAVHFTLTSPATPTTAAVAGDDTSATGTSEASAPVVTAAPVVTSQGTGSSGGSSGVWIAVAVVVLGVLGALAGVLRSRRGAGRPKV